MHLESLEQQMRLMAHALPQALELRAIQIVRKNRVVIGMRALLDNNAGALPRRQTAHVSKTLLGNDNVEIMLCLIDMRSERNDTADTGGIGLAGPGGGRVHDAVFGVAEEVGGSTEAV